MGEAERARRLPSDEAERRVARADLASSLVVEAGAGTGKTTLLVERVLALVGERGATLDRVVAITFTEKAAGELKVRLRAALEKALEEAQEPLVEGRFARAVQDLERAPIETIHAFASRLLRERPVEAGVDPRFETLDELAAELLFEETWEAWIAAAVARGSDDLRRAYCAGIGPKLWKALGRALLEARVHAKAAVPPSGPPPDVRPWIAAWRRRAEDERRRLEMAVRASDDRLLVALGDFAGQLADWEQAGAIEAEAFVLRDLKLPAASGSRARYRDPAVLERARAEVAEIAREAEQVRELGGEHLLRSLLHRLSGFVQSYERAKRERGLLDFDDLLLLARDLLSRNREVRRSLAARFSHFLVDEFQDTDPLQAEIVFLMCDESGEAPVWEEVEVPPGRLFLVGDPKQSIYRFRRADIELYEAAKRTLLGVRDVVTVSENFRADAGLIDWVNALFLGEMVPPGDGQAYQPRYRPLTAYHRDVREPRAVVALRPAAPSPSGAGTAGEQRVLEAEAITRLIHHARAEAWTVRGEGGRRRGLRFGDVALLLRAMTDIETYEEALRRADVPYRLTGGKDYYRRTEVQALLRVLEAVDDPTDAIAVVAALRSPFFGVPDPVLFEHRLHGGRFDYLGARPAAPELADAFACLAELRRRRHEVDPSALILEVLERTHFAALVALKPHGEQRTANLFKLADEAAALGQAGQRSLRAVVRYFTDLEGREVEESDSPLAEDGDEAVRVMTVHAAKGLEFPMVVLADLGREGRAELPRLLVERRDGRLEARIRLRDPGVRDATLATAGYAELWEQEKRRLDAELLRVLYVAVTRARDMLVLPVFPPSPANRAPFLAALAGHLPGVGSPAAEGLAERVLVIDAAALPPPPERDPLRSGLHPLSAGAERARERLRLRRAWEAERRQALERAARGIRLLHPSRAGAEASAEAWPELAGDASRDEGRREGQIVHAVLEWVDLDDPAAARLAAQDQARAAGLDRAAAARVERLVGRALAAPFVRRTWAGGRPQREVPFSLQTGETLLAGSVDLIAEEGPFLVVADWKTDAAASAGGAALAEIARRYRPQGLLYALAVERTTGRTVRELVLIFLDGPERAVEVTFPFDAAGRAEAGRLFGSPAPSRVQAALPFG